MPQILCPLYRAAKQFGSDAAIISEHGTISFRQLYEIVEVTTQNLLKCRIKNGSRVAIMSPSCPEYLIVLLALWRLKAIGCPLSSRYPPALVKKLLRSIRYDILLRQSDLKRLAGSGSAGKAPKPHYFNPDFPATIMFTSGTTAIPKSVLHTYENHYFNAKGSNKNIPLHKGDRWLLSLPLYHVAGTGIIFRCLLAGAAVVIPPAKLSLSAALLKYRISHLSLVSTQLQKFLDNPTHSRQLKRLRAILLGGSFISPHLIQKAITFKLPIYKSYGLTEAASQVTTTRKNERADRLLTAGRILKYRELRIGHNGEIQVKGEVLFKGYLGQKRNAALTRDGWFKTGDTGYLTRDGYLVVTGRKDTMFISGGENIFPEEIEKTLLTDKRIVNAAVVPVTDPLFGSRPAAFIKFATNQSVPAPILQKILLRQLPKFKIPDRFYAWPKQLSQNTLKFNRQQLNAVLQKNPVALK